VPVWARRSSFEIDNTFLWVAELFLPAIGGFKNLDE
jgi:chorismate-pyruvate lyase